MIIANTIGNMEDKKGLSPEELEASKRLRAIWNKKKNELGLTQEKAAEHLNITQGAVSHFLNGRKAISPWNTLRFASLLAVDASEIQDVENAQLPAKVSGLTAKQRTILELVDWLDDDETDELIRHLEAQKLGKIENYRFVQKKGG